MAAFYLYFFLISLSLTKSCDVFNGMTCSCYESTEIRCTMSKIVPLTFSPSSISYLKKFSSIDIKFVDDDAMELDRNYFSNLNQLFPDTARNALSITLRFQNFRSFHAKSSCFSQLFQGLISPYKRLTIEFHPVKAKSIVFEQNTFDNIHINELSIFADSLTSPFESIFNNTNITHLNIEGALLAHDPLLLKDYNGHIQSLKITRMIDTVNSEEFPPFPVQSYTIEAHKMRTLDALSFINYTQLTGLNIIQPDVSITSNILNGMENIQTLKSVSFDAERIADGALKHVKNIETLILGTYTKILDTEIFTSLKSLKQLDVRYVQFSTLHANTSCSLADYINRRRMMGLTVYLPNENPYCDCILVFLNNMVDDGSQLVKCQSTNNDRCLFSSCSIVSEYFTRKQKEDMEEEQQKKENPPSVITPSQSIPIQDQYEPPSIDLNDNDSPYYSDDNTFIGDERKPASSTINPVEVNNYDEDETIRKNPDVISSETTTNSLLFDPDESNTQYATRDMKRVHPDSKKTQTNKYLAISWIPFAIIAACLFLSLIIAMISYIIYHKQRTTSFKLVPQAAPIV
ncbi:unnamed protein product [Rotaria magnacalcarata]|uniref:Uncharacterized protein n=8 Tax=Rotaria magnacalcarata TaxID=392030 RepID=A0A815LYH3_9BILA|nr:unnamed protein product [Rotaria magnacalcarata]CAF1603567.1 unnamed protein product [Rotaria magnacalcarata]CAF2059091.1 unnamed protein product [Rotaria magnacalcarata]